MRRDSNQAHPPLASVCVYCGSSAGARASYQHAARALGGAIAAAGLRLVYGGARVGLMGALADGALAAHGRVLGVIPRALTDRELAHIGLTELVVVADMHARKLAMSRAADAFIAMPGGLGTLEELFETLTWHQLGLHDKPCGVLDVDGFYAPLLDCLAHMRTEGFVAARQVERLCVASQPAALLAALGVAAASGEHG